METLKNHPKDELLAAYAAASLPLSQALCISVHLEHCPKCTQNLHRLNDLGSELMVNLQPAEPLPGLKQKLFDQIDLISITAAPIEKVTSPTDVTNQSLPRCLHQFIKTGYEDVSWKRLSSDIHSYELCRDQNNAKVELLRIKAGGTSGTHKHMGDEYTVILEGSFSDELGLYQQGDFLVRNSFDKHTPVATIDKECICLAVTEAPIQFTGFFSRLLNPLIRRSYA
ncbi:MAG: putative transcriptional regulator [Gammaproteobacteria bacterium]|jgi:putative transcriptional regulator